MEVYKITVANVKTVNNISGSAISNNVDDLILM